MAETVALERTLLRMRLPGRLTFLFRIRFGLYAVLARIGAELDGPYASPGRPLFAGSSDFRNVT